MNESAPDFSILKRGVCRFHSPLRFSTVQGDNIADFVPEGARILLDDRIEALTEGAEMPSLELAGPRQQLFFDPSKVKAAVVNCGGICPGLNDVTRSLVNELAHYGAPEVIGIKYGYWGMVPENGHTALTLTPSLVRNIHFYGGSFLGSSRGPRKVDDMLDFLAARKINVLFTVGGDGTQRGALAVSKGARERGLDLVVVGIPKTIDNDLAFTERTFGYETACEIARDVIYSGQAEAEGALYGGAVVKLMGRHSGFIAAQSALASGTVDFVLIPEIDFDLEGQRGLFASVERKLRIQRHVLVVVAEGAGQRYLTRDGSKPEHDLSGNLKLGDIGHFLKGKLSDYLHKQGFPGKIRYIDPSYIIRSAPANASDHVFCTTLAQNAVHAAMSGRTELVVSLWHGSFVHIPMETAVSRRKTIDPDSAQWRAVVESTGQPAVMIN